MIPGSLPKLHTLAICGQVGDELLSELLHTQLPSLEALEICKTQITPDALRAILKSARPGLPALKRLGIAFSSDRREDYTDWNGAQGGWEGYEPMRDPELRSEFLDPAAWS